MKYIFIVISVLIFAGCAPKNILLQNKNVDIYDLKTIPQNIETYTNAMQEEELHDIQKNYEQSYFRMWNTLPSETLQDVKWPFESYKYGDSYGENLKLLPQSFFDAMLQNADFDNYMSVSKKALTIKDTDIRSFPTDRPLFKDPLSAGEGFPFDYLQNSSIHANKPIFISHYSKDKEWVYAFSSFASGWIKTSDFVYLDDKYTQQWQKAKQITFIKEGEAIYNENQDFLFKTKIGMMLPLISEDKDYYTVLFVSSYKHNMPLYEKAKVKKEFATNEVLHFNQKNLNTVINEAVKTNYGWGGLYGQRDCSSMIRDIFTPFGLWLPRNSYMQSKVGEVISFEGLNDEEKINLIKQKALPFETLLYKKGHILLYVGIYDDHIIALHNTWGIKTKKDEVEGRVVVGEPIFSTLRLGKNQENYDEEAEILKNLQSMNILTR